VVIGILINKVVVAYGIGTPLVIKTGYFSLKSGILTRY